MTRHIRLAAAFLSASAVMAAPALAQTPDSICDDVRLFSSSSLGDPPFRSLVYEGHGGLKQPEGLTRGYEFGSCQTDDDDFSNRRIISCVTHRTPTERVESSFDEQRFAAARQARDALAARLATCEWMADWNVVPPKRDTGYGAAAEDHVFEDPRLGRQVIARAERIRTGSRGRWNIGYETKLVVRTPKADEPS